MLSANDDKIAECLKSIPVEKIDSLFFRVLPLRRLATVNSAEGARIHGGRFNPPENLAQRLCGIDDGFGLLYTATNPITCLFECEHIRRGLGGHDYQISPIEPSLLITFRAKSDRVLDLRNPKVLDELGLTIGDLTGLDDRFVLNEEGKLTPLQRVGAAMYKVGLFSGMLTPSRYNDIVPSFCFNFLPSEVKPVLQDDEKVLGRLTFT